MSNPRKKEQREKLKISTRTKPPPLPPRVSPSVFKRLDDLSGDDDDRLDLDHPDFDAELYAAKNISELGLDELLSLQTDLIKQTKTLDGEMKSLMYENYEKFISAGDTINKIEGSLQELESNIKFLEEHIKSISLESEQLGETFYEKTKTSKNLALHLEYVKLVENLLKLPSKILNKISKNTDQNADALKEFQIYEKLFQQLKYHFAKLDEIGENCRDMLKEYINTTSP